MKNTILLIIYITITTFCLCSCTDSKYLEKAAILAKQNDYQAALSILENKIHVKDNPKYLIAHGLCCSNISFPRYRDAIKDFDALRYTEYGKGTKSLYLLATWSYYINEYEDVYANFVGGGTPYYITNIEDTYYLTEHRVPGHSVWSFKVSDGQITDVESIQ